ncbi:hypothetical protein LOTGIDRAFT_236088 [Lottia gigantea]|uniref:CUB domain-containing protein n=1 Tax=Lottia gigantea TaxID=225164 RepID=V3Z2R5_LOTGI|nr:hypothetical protein LOTGIDRAFT_236088 [Lottia gigantea]ESO84878.1 hypothetical protein LOTGIDRAFT_236088 [Lottia gigantea]
MLKFLILCTLISVYCSTVSSYTDTEYVNSNCGSTVYVTSATKLKLENYMFYGLDSPCEITLTAYDSFQTGLSLEGHFLDFDLPCNYGSVTLYDSTNRQSRTILADQLCGYKPSTFYKGSGESIVIEINKNEGYSQYTASFNFLLTESHDGFCDDTEFQCDNFECINNLLTCDGNNNCGDNSDEGSVCFWTIGTIAGIGIGGGVLFMIVVIIIAVSCRRKQRVVYQNQYGSMPYTNGPQVIAQPYMVMPQPQYGAAPFPGYQQQTPAPPAPPAYKQEQPKTTVKS